MKSYTHISSFKNETTFLFIQPVETLSKDDLIILDHYAFSIEELKSYGENSLDSFFKNPHELAQNFSAEAIRLLENHPTLKEYALQHKSKLAHQKAGISLNTVNAVRVMLLGINHKEDENSKDPRVAFLEFKSTLSPEEENKLDQYVIKLPHLVGPSVTTAFTCGEASSALFRPSSLKNKMLGSKDKPAQYQERIMTFAEAMMGGSQASPCLRTLQIFLWQFVLNFNPRASDSIPERVKQMAAADHYLLGVASEKLNFQNKFSPSFSSIAEEDELEDPKMAKATSYKKS